MLLTFDGFVSRIFSLQFKTPEDSLVSEQLSYLVHNKENHIKVSIKHKFGWNSRNIRAVIMIHFKHRCIDRQSIVRWWSNQIMNGSPGIIWMKMWKCAREYKTGYLFDPFSKLRIKQRVKSAGKRHLLRSSGPEERCQYLSCRSWLWHLLHSVLYSASFVQVNTISVGSRTSYVCAKELMFQWRNYEYSDNFL